MGKLTKEEEEKLKNATGWQHKDRDLDLNASFERLNSAALITVEIMLLLFKAFSNCYSSLHSFCEKLLPLGVMNYDVSK